MSEQIRLVELDSYEQGLMVNGLNSFRNSLLEQDQPTEDVEDFILKVIDAPSRKEKRRSGREAR